MAMAKGAIEARGASDPPLPLDAPFGTEFDTGFRDALNPEAPSLIEAVKRASRYAGVGSDGIIIDKLALLLGMLEAGLLQPDRHSSSSWLATWARDINSFVEEVLTQRERGAEIRFELARGGLVKPSISLRGLLPRACELARLTVGRERTDLRHLLFAMLEHPGLEWTALGRTPKDAEFASLRQKIVDNIAARSEPGERLDVWRGLLADLQPPAPSSPGSPDESSAQVADDRYRTQADNPALVDLLDRDPFAQVLAERIRMLRTPADGAVVKEEDRRRAFMIHLHGRWGSGKSSLLNLLEQYLVRDEGTGPAARVVWFNAWVYNSRRPPWWALLDTLYRSLQRARNPPLSNGERWALRYMWWRWRLRADVLPLLAIGVVVGLVGCSMFVFGSATVGPMVTLAGAVITVSVALHTYARTAMLGSQKAAQIYADLKSDPLGPVAKLFSAMVDRIEAPLVMFIDDLDRCDRDSLVDLLEGIQNLFKATPITYVVAADRTWITTAFEKRYADFAGMGEAGRPLGYLFLEKLFQISAAMPRLTPEVQARYLDSLTGPAAPAPALGQAAREAAERAVAGVTDEKALDDAIDRAARISPEQERATRAAAAVQMAGRAAQAKTEDRLRPMLALMEANPRAMKRLVNEVAMAQSRGMIEGRRVSPEARARWMILSLRWPLFADFIADRPQLIDGWRPQETNGPPASPGSAADLPEAIRGLVLNRALAATIGGGGDRGVLDADALRTMLA